MHADALVTQGSGVSNSALPHLGAAQGAGYARPAQGSGGKFANRRKSPRYSAVNERLWAGWWSEDEFVLVEAQLLNISEGGVMVSVNPSPAAGQHVWMRLSGSATHESLRAAVLEAKWSVLKRRFTVRLAFRETCPNEFLETAAYGQSTGASRLGLD